MEELINKLKQQIIEVLNLEDVSPEDIANDAPLFGEGLGLDSIDALELIVLMEKEYGIDALELIVLMEKEYGIKLKNPAEGKQIFKSIEVMAKYISENRTK